MSSHVEVSVLVTDERKQTGNRANPPPSDFAAVQVVSQALAAAGTGQEPALVNSRLGTCLGPPCCSKSVLDIIFDIHEEEQNHTIFFFLDISMLGWEAN